MKRRRILILAAVVVLTFIATTAYAPFNEIRINYYSDDTFSTWAGAFYRYCSGSEWTFGGTGPWRMWDEYSCWSGQRVVHKCHQSDGMGGWIPMSCPY